MDFKKREVLDFFSGYLVSTSLFIRLFVTIFTKNTFYFLYPSLVSALFFVIFILLYHFGQWGGGDTKLLASTILSISHLPTLFPKIKLFNIDIPFLLSFLILIIFVGALYNICWIIYYAIKHYKRLSHKGLSLATLIACIVVAIIFKVTTGSTYLLINLILIGVFIAIFILAKDVQEKCMIRTITVKNLSEGDWVIEPVYYKNQIIYKPHPSGIELKDIEKLKKINPNLKVKIKTGIPFVPVFLLSLLFQIIIQIILVN